MAEASLAAVEAALGPPGRVASLIIPADCQWEPGPEPLSAIPSPGLRENPRSGASERRRACCVRVEVESCLAAMHLARAACAPPRGWRPPRPAESGPRPSHRARSAAATCPVSPLYPISRSRPARRLRTSRAWCSRARASRSLPLPIRISLRDSHPTARRCIRSRTRTGRRRGPRARGACSGVGRAGVASAGAGHATIHAQRAAARP